MIFLDIDVPEYESMRTQEHKVPELIKTLRGKGTLENSNEFGYDERLHITFTVNEENLIKLLKVYSRFQTLCLIPLFNKNLKKKIYDAYLKYKKNTVKNMMINVGIEEDEIEKSVNNVFNSKPEEEYLEAIKKFNYKVNPNVTDCLMVFLESFSFKTIQDTSDGYELEMILWVCSDLTFYNSEEKQFLEEYYRCFSEKATAFKDIDKEIENIFESKHDDINIQFSNSYNEQKTYNPDKTFEKIEQPVSINIPSKYIAQVEIRAMNNLKRIPIVGKTKGFIQHLGKGEIGVTVKLVFNQRNALEEEIIHDIKSISMYQQEFITTSVSNFYLFKGMDIRELNLSTSIIEEPSDDVDITVITLFFTASSTNKKEAEQNYFKLLDRADSRINLKLFNRFLDRVLSDEECIIVNEKGQNEIHNNEKYDEKLKKYLDMIISKGDTTDVISWDGQSLTGSFKLMNLVKAYRQELFLTYKNNLDKGLKNDSEEYVDIDYKVDYGFVQGVKEFLFTSGYPQDSLFMDSVLFRIQRLAFYMKAKYYKELSREEKNEVIKEISVKDNNTQEEFLEKVFSLFLSEFFDSKFLANNKNMFCYSVSNVFKIEVLNNIVNILVRILEDDFASNDIFTHDNKIQLKIINEETGKLDSTIKSSLTKAIEISFSVMREIMNTDMFVTKVKDFVITNYYNGADDQNFLNSVDKAVTAEVKKAISRLDSFINGINSNNDYILEISEMIFKLQILGCRIEKYVGKEERKTRYRNEINRDYNFNLTTEAKVYLLSISIMSLFIADLNYEKTVVGAIASESAKNWVGPHVVTYTAIKSTTNDIASSLTKTFNGKTYDEYINSPHEVWDEQIEYATQYKDMYDKLMIARKIYEITFGRENLESLEGLNKTFIKESSINKDFQTAHGVTVFSNFDTPMSFLKKISNNCEKFKQIFKDASADLKSLDKITNSTSPEDSLKTINVSGDKEVDKLIKMCTSVFSPTSAIADATINKIQSGAIVSASFLQTELLGEFKLMRGMRSATKLLQCQYERMMPDYEVYIIDEKAVEQAMERGYDYQDKIYSISNIMSINIKKDDISNLKFATIRIMNTMPHYIGLDTIFESQSAFSDNKEAQVVYSNKFVTEKLVFRSGMLVNISIDQSSQFFDFTGRIDSVELTTNIITLRCSSFASELLGSTLDVDNVYSDGLSLKMMWRDLKDTINLFQKKPYAISDSKIGYINGHIIPSEYINGKTSSDNENSFKTAGGASCIAYAALSRCIDSLKHLDCRYNNLILGRNLSRNYKGNLSAFDKGSYNEYGTGGTTAHRISENFNAVEFDLSFYGVQKISKGSYNPVTGNLATGDRIVKGHSSFIPNNIFKDNEYDSLESSEPWITVQNVINEINPINAVLRIFGTTYSYKREQVKMYDILNDLTLRNPATYWDVFESGHYGTLFFGRNNYMVTRKNKISSLSREDVDKISNLAVHCFNNSVDANTKCIPCTEYAFVLNYLSELASFYDQNFSKDKKLYDLQKSKLLTDTARKSDFFRETSEENKDYYNEESPASNIILAISGYNLVSCSISTNENYINSVTVKYKPGIGDRFSRFTDMLCGKSNMIVLKSFEGLPDARMRTKAIDPSLTVDLHSKEQAFEYAQSVMYKELVNYYSGKIVILYHPDIKKNDEVLLIDSRNHISGTVVVKDFEHILDAEAGALTIITPGMKVKTSSMMTDVYLTGLINKLEYEWLKMKTSHYPEEEIDKVSQSATVELQKLYKDLFANIETVPISFEYTGFDLEFDKDAYENEEGKTTKEITTSTNGNSSNSKTPNKSKQFYEEIKYKKSTNIITPRNISSLPFKLYPLVKNGRALIPDEDIYNSTERPFSFARRLLLALKYLGYNLLDVSKHCNNINYLFSGILKNTDISNAGIYERILQMYFPGFREEYIGKDEKNDFIQRLLHDNYYQIPFLEENRVDINEGIFDKESIVFFNCKKLNQYDTERIKSIAKMLSQYKIVNLVELDGRITSDATKDGKVIGHETNKFTVVELLRLEMERLCRKGGLVDKGNEQQRHWTTVIQRRLITEKPEGDYDDIGAVLINCDEITAKNNISDIETLTVQGNWYDGKTVTKTKNVIKYSIKNNNAGDFFGKLHIYVFHNYYGKELGKESVSYELRRSLLDDLFRNIKSEQNSIIIGDFNLNIKDITTVSTVKENANNEYYYTDYLTYIRIPTTIGDAKYDQILTKNDLKKYIDKTGVAISSGMINSYSASDHYPIYLFFVKNKVKLLK